MIAPQRSGVVGALQALGATVSAELTEPPLQHDPIKPGVHLPSLEVDKEGLAESGGGGGGGQEQGDPKGLKRRSIMLPEEQDDGVQRTGGWPVLCLTA